MVLLQDSFAALPYAFREGQRILTGMRDIFKLYVSRVLYAVLLILAVAVAQAGFPFAPKHNALLTLLTVGIPTLAMAAWARPIAPRPAEVGRALALFAVPAAVSVMLVGLGVYVAYFLPGHERALQASTGTELFRLLQEAQSTAQTALTIVSVWCGLLLILFAQPPNQRWIAGEQLVGDRRPVALTVFLVTVFGAILVEPELRSFFDLAPLSLLDHIVLGAVALAWCFLVRWVWRQHLLERWLGLSPAK
jgi:cation-transporting P-type ATPase E